MQEPIPSTAARDTSNVADAGSDGASADHEEWLLDEALMETFPASDPVCPATMPSIREVRHDVPSRAEQRDDGTVARR